MPQSASAGIRRPQASGLAPALASLVLLSIAAAALLAPGPARAAEPAATATVAPEAADRSDPLDFLDRMGAWYAAHPELETTRSSGWKPYQRARWGIERTWSDGRGPSAQDRWNVWQARLEREGLARATATWFEIGPVNLCGRVLDIEFAPGDPSTVYVGTASGGLWKSTDGGDTWAPLTDELPTLAIGGIAVDPFDPDIVVIGTGEGTPNGDRVGGVGILRSTDGGATWGPTSLSFPVTSGHGFHCIEVNPISGLYLAGAIDGVFASTDQGQTWSLADSFSSGNDCFDVKWKPGDQFRIYTAVGSVFGGTVIRMSANGGSTWSTLGGGLPSSSGNGKTKLAVTPANSAYVYANFVSSSTYGSRGVYRSTNDGTTWTARNTTLNMTGGQGWYNLTLAVDPNDVDRVIAGGVEVYASSNGGTTFAEVGDGYGLGTETAIHWDHHAIAYEPGSNSAVWVGTDGGVWRSTNDGATWASRREGIATYQFYDICVAQSDPDVTLGGTQDNGVPGRVGFDDWFTSNLFADGFVCNIDPTNADVVFGEAQGGYHVRSTDGGLSWTDINNGIFGSGLWVTPVAMDQAVPTRLYTESSSGIFRTTNSGSSWSSVSGHSAIWIDVSLADNLTVWSVNGGTAAPRVSTNAGTSWSTASAYGFSVGSSQKVLAHPTEPNGAFVTFWSYGAGVSVVARTTDRGATWTDVSGDLPRQPVNAMAVDPQYPDEWYIGTEVGVWRSTNGGVNWLPFEIGLPNARIADLEIRDDARKLVAGTYGRGAWEVAITSPGAVDATIVAAGGPLQLMLDPPSPNPVTDRTVLRFAARHEGRVTLAVYDVAGRMVSNLAELSTGDGVIRRAPWLVDDVPSGVYFAVLRAGDQSVTRKLVVTK